MFSRLNQYLLTHYPLVWNTRLIWVMSINIILHILFFTSGYFGLRAKDISGYYNPADVGGANLYTFSILCSLLLIIVWLVFYLRNNAFKQFYAIGKWYLAKEFGIMLLIIFTSISYFESYSYGVKIKARSITPINVFIREVDELNSGLAFFPGEKADYFILNNCDHLQLNHRYSDVDPSDTSDVNIPDTTRIKLKTAWRRPDALSYLHYCSAELENYSLDVAPAPMEQHSAANNQLIRSGNRTAIRQKIDAVLAIAKKYDIDQRIDVNYLVNAVFAKPYNKIDTLIPREEYSIRNEERYRNQQYIYSGYFDGVYNFLDKCLPSSANLKSQVEIITIIGYVSLGLSILLLVYRRFSRKVFLVSVIGTLVWALLVGLIAASSGSNGSSILVMLILLCLIFLLVALFNLSSREMKLGSGVLLSWHIYLLPYLVLFIQILIGDYYMDMRSSLNKPGLDVDALMASRFPFSTWVYEHLFEISIVNLILVVLYCTFFFNKLAKRWHSSPEE